MDQSEINKRNEAIAIFMGATYPTLEEINKILPSWDYETREELPEDVKSWIDLPWMPKAALAVKDLKFHTSWEWIMPVVGKISNEKFPDGENIFPRTFGAINEETGEFMVRFNRHHLFQSESFIESVFLAVSDYCLSLNH